jgi:hypothetical protein
MLLQPTVLTMAWGSVVRQLAAGLDVELDGVEEWYERLPAPETFEVASGTIEKGTAAALRFEVRGMRAGRPSSCSSTSPGCATTSAPDWPQPTGHGCYRVTVTGEPNYTLDLQLLGSDGDHNTAGLKATAMRLVNAVPAVIAGPPGARLTALDLPLVTGGSGLLPDAPDNPYRGVAVTSRTDIDDRIATLAAEIDVDATHRIWDQALGADPWTGPPVWLHGDLHPANTLVTGGTLTAVIDFGDLCAGDPATDLAGAWMMLPTAVMGDFNGAYGGVDADLERRSLGWALIFGLILLEIGLRDRPTYERVGRTTLDRVIRYSRSLPG